VEWHGERLGGPAVAIDPRVSPDGPMLAFQAIVDGFAQPEELVVRPPRRVAVPGLRTGRRGRVPRLAIEQRPV
jgi:hypothetical protein